MDSVETTDKRLEVEVLSTVVTEPFGVWASTSCLHLGCCVNEQAL